MLRRCIGLGNNIRPECQAFTPSDWTVCHVMLTNNGCFLVTHSALRASSEKSAIFCAL